jgi:C-terminal processing protease CtpA/Prc
MKKKTIVHAILIPTLIVSLVYLNRDRLSELYHYTPSPETDKAVLIDEDAVYISFTREVYDIILTNFWEKIAETDLATTYSNGMKLKNPTITPTSTWDGVETQIRVSLTTLDTDQKKNFITELNRAVIEALPPLGRSGLYSEEKQTELWDTVKNIDKSTDLYEEIAVAPDASTTEIAQAIETKTEALTTTITSPTATSDEITTAKETLKKVERAKETLKDSVARERYNTHGSESTVYAEVLAPGIARLSIKRFSPITHIELNDVLDKIEKDNITNLILDLRGNIGGAIDILPQLLGLLIGQYNYSYEIYSHGEYIPSLTIVPIHPSITQLDHITLLTDERMQSTAEVLTVTLKKFRQALVVGRTTRGWGTIEGFYPITTVMDTSTTYSVFLVHQVTLREDRQPIEGRGVNPDISIDEAGWQERLEKKIDDKKLYDFVISELERE